MEIGKKNFFLPLCMHVYCTIWRAVFSLPTKIYIQPQKIKQMFDGLTQTPENREEVEFYSEE